jgi:hypothetical protein
LITHWKSLDAIILRNPTSPQVPQHFARLNARHSAAAATAAKRRFSPQLFVEKAVGTLRSSPKEARIEAEARPKAVGREKSTALVTWSCQFQDLT